MPAGAVRPGRTGPDRGGEAASIDPPLRDCPVEVSRPNAGLTGMSASITSASLSTATLR